MGTRSLTVFQDEDSKEIVVMYRHMDGYPTGHGAELKKFLGKMRIVNGISLAEQQRVANGMGCLAAQTVAHFKDGAGSFYLYPAGTRDCGEDYVYTVYPQNERVNLKVEESSGELLYNGPIEAFEPS